MIERVNSWGTFASRVAKQVVKWLAIILLVAATGYMGYLNIQLKADQKVREAEYQTQVLAGQVEILQATIEGLKIEGEDLQSPRLR